MLSTKSKAKPKPKASEAATSLAAGVEPIPAASWEFEAIGTCWWIGIFEPIPKRRLVALQRVVAARIEAFDHAYSRFRPDSLVMAIARGAGVCRFPADAEKMFTLYRQLYEATAGMVTPLIGDVLAAAGYDAGYSLRPGTLKKPPSWDQAMAINGSVVKTTQPVLLDFGAAGKGYLVDLIAACLHAAGLKNFCIDGGGDMVAHGNEVLRIGLEHPDDAMQVIGVASLQNGALCGSAGNRRAWREYHHIMNPRTLQPSHDIKAAWVVAKDALTADGLATALFFVSPETLRQFEFEFVTVDARNRIACSPNFPATLFTRSDDVAHD